MTRRGLMCAAVLLLVAPVSGATQQPVSWRVSSAAEQTWFSAAAGRDGTRFGPSSGLGLGLGVSRDFRAWELGLELTARPSVLRASDSASVIEIPSVSFGRSSAALSVMRGLAHVGRAELMAGAGMRADAWTLTEQASRLRLGGEIRFGLRFDAGALRIQNMVKAGRSSSPFEQEDLPDGYRKRALRWISAGMTVSIGL